MAARQFLLKSAARTLDTAFQAAGASHHQHLMACAGCGITHVLFLHSVLSERVLMQMLSCSPVLESRGLTHDNLKNCGTLSSPCCLAMQAHPTVRRRRARTSRTMRPRRRRRARRKKKSSFLFQQDYSVPCDRLAVDVLVFSNQGSECDDSESCASSEDPEPAEMQDSACVLGLLRKDHARPLNAGTLDALRTKQLAYALSGVTERLTASDILETGGELETRLACLGFFLVCQCVEFVICISDFWLPTSTARLIHNSHAA